MVGVGSGHEHLQQYAVRTMLVSLPGLTIPYRVTAWPVTRFQQMSRLTNPYHRLPMGVGLNKRTLPNVTELYRIVDLALPRS